MIKYSRVLTFFISSFEFGFLTGKVRLSALQLPEFGYCYVLSHPLFL